MVTLVDVAEKAGVSRATVSRVVRGEGKVGEKCRKHVQKVIDEMGYRPNITARMLASNRSEIIGLITPNLSRPFYGAISIGVEKYAKANGYHVMMSNSFNDAETEADAIRSLTNLGCTNIILHSNHNDDDTIIQYTKNVNGLVLLNRMIPEIAERCMWLDNVMGTRLAAEHLFKSGHRKIAVITNPLHLADQSERMKGIKQTFEELGLTLDESLIYHNKTSGIDAGFEGIEEFKRRGVDYTAIITTNDTIAIGAMNALRTHGISVPEQVSVVGFDDTYLAEIAYPALTTIHYPIQEMSEYATKLSIEITSNGKTDKSKTHLFMPHLVERDSVNKK